MERDVKRTNLDLETHCRQAPPIPASPPKDGEAGAVPAPPPGRRAELTVERLLLGLLLGGIGLGCALVLWPFFSAIFWAAILVFTTWPVCDQLRSRLHLRPSAAAGVMIALTAIVVVLPLALAAPGSAEDVDQLRHALQDAVKDGLPPAPAWVFQIPLLGHPLGALWNTWAADLSAMAESFRPYFGMIAEAGFSLLLGIANGVVGFVLALFIAFFFYTYAEPISLRLHAVLRRIAGPQADRLIVVTGATVRGAVYGILGTAVVQGILTALGLWLAGVPRPILLGALASFVAIFPIGAPLVWIPASLWLLSNRHIASGIFLLIYGVVAVSGADSVIRPWFIARGARLPFLLTLLGVLGGAMAFGLLGIFLGPVLLGVGYTLLIEFSEGRPSSDESSADLRAGRFGSD